MGIPIWESHGESHGNSHVGILWEFPWESYGNSHRKPVGMGWEWELKFHSHGNPDYEKNFPQLLIVVAGPIIDKLLIINR